MQMVKKVMFIIVMVWLAVLVFMPKSAFYYTLEERLSEQDIRLNEETIEEGWFTLNVENVKVYVKGIEVAKVKTLSLFTLLFYSTLQIEGVEVDEALWSKVPASIEETTLTHSVVHPLSLSVDANGSFGNVEGEANLLQGAVHLNFVETKEIGTVKPFLKKDEKGWYYEGSF